jgi:hypothetical protein
MSVLFWDWVLVAVYGSPKDSWGKRLPVDFFDQKKSGCRFVNLLLSCCRVEKFAGCLIQNRMLLRGAKKSLQTLICVD